MDGQLPHRCHHCSVSPTDPYIGVTHGSVSPTIKMCQNPILKSAKTPWKWVHSDTIDWKLLSQHRVRTSQHRVRDITTSGSGHRHREQKSNIGTRIARTSMFTRACFRVRGWTTPFLTPRDPMTRSSVTVAKRVSEPSNSSMSA